VFDAPRELVYRAFTDPDHLAAWWGPIGNSLPRERRIGNGVVYLRYLVPT
jgi:uncharacterized protein YndB with AHSA1/START domain